MAPKIDWQRSILTWEYFSLPLEGGPGSIQAGLISLDGKPYGSVFPEKKLLATRELAEALAMSAGVQFLAVPYTRALATGLHPDADWQRGLMWEW